MVLHARVVRGSGGGPDKTVLRSAAYADHDLIRMAAVYIYDRGTDGIDVLRAHARRWGCPLWEVPESTGFDPNTVRSLLQLCRKLRVTVWHAHDYKTDALGLLLRQFWPMRLVTTVHGFTRETRRTRLYYHVDNFCLARYDHVLAVSRRLVDHCRAHRVPDRALSYLPNAIDPDEFRRSRDVPEARLAQGIDPGRAVIGVVSRLSPEKGVDRAVRLMKPLAERLPTAELHLIGDGPQRAELEGLATSLGVAARVRFHGWQPDARPLYEAMDLLLLPSYTEGFPNVVLEAMAMGVPVVATDVGDVREVLEDGRAGVVLPQAEADWVGPVADVAASPSVRRDLAHRALDRVRTDYTFQARMATVMGVYRNLLRLTPSSRRMPRAA